MQGLLSQRQLSNKENFLAAIHNVKPSRNSSRVLEKAACPSQQYQAVPLKQPAFAFHPSVPSPEAAPSANHCAMGSTASTSASMPRPSGGHTQDISSELLDVIIAYITSKDEKETRPSHEYMSNFREVNPKMRAILIDWLVDVNIKFKLLPQTLFMTVSVIDRFLALKEVSRQKLQLVGVTALMIVGKYEEIYPPLLKDYVSVCDSAYSAEDILQMESEILSTLKFELNKTCSFVFLEYFRKKLNIEERAFSFCRYLLENSMLDLSYLRFSGFVVAAGSIYLVNKIFKKEGWSSFLESVTGVNEQRAKACAKELFAILSRNELLMLNALKRKFSSPELFEISKYRIEKVSAGHP